VLMPSATTVTATTNDDQIQACGRVIAFAVTPYCSQGMPLRGSTTSRRIIAIGLVTTRRRHDEASFGRRNVPVADIKN
jgi:hypothetical protein